MSVNIKRKLLHFLCIKQPPIHTQVYVNLVEYTVLIDDGVGATVRKRVSALNCSPTECSHTHYPAEGSRAEFGVTVEAAGCVTRQTVCIEAPVCK